MKRPLAGTAGARLAVYLPTVTMRESFRFIGSAGQVTPRTVTMIGIPEFRTASPGVTSDVINMELNIGGNIPAGIRNTVCFSIDGGCCFVGPNGPNFIPYTLTVSGAVLETYGEIQKRLRLYQ